MAGSVIFSAMYLVCAFSPNIYLVIIAFGVVGGISFGMTYLSCFIILVDYFDKRLGMVNGLMMAG